MKWQESIEQKLNLRKQKFVALNIKDRSIAYDEKIKLHRNISKITGDEEIVRAFLVDRLINELNYLPEFIEIEKEYSVGRPKVNKPRIDIILRDRENKPYLFIELKAPDKFESDKVYIEGQLYKLAKLEKTKPKYLVYYTIQENNNIILDNLIFIDYEKYPNYEDWENGGFVSSANEIPAGYGEPKKQPFIKGDSKYDLKSKISKKELESLAKILHNVLWGGGGTTDSEIFYSLVNIILAKIQDETEKNNGQEYDFQIYSIGKNSENPNNLYERINALYRRALKEKLNITDKNKLAKAHIINEEKFPLNKLLYCISKLEGYSFYEGRNSLNGKDIMGDFFESITRDGFKQTKGQFFTPTPIVQFIIYALNLDNLAIDKLNNTRELPYIIDPSSGSATYLIEVMKIITKELKYKQFDKLNNNHQTQDRFEELFVPDRKENKWAKEYLYGAEINFDLGTASKVNMILHGDGSSNIFVKDGLLPFRFYTKDTAPNHLNVSFEDTLYKDTQAREVNGNFDCIISNPPFSVELDNETKRLLPRSFLFSTKKNSENLFIERWYQLLKENGRIGVVLPESVFDTTENKYIRLFIFKYFKVKAVVSLPQITFEPYTSTKTSLLFMQKKTRDEIKTWNQIWDKYVNEWNMLKTRVSNLLEVYLHNKERSKMPSLKGLKFQDEVKILQRMLKISLDCNTSVKEIIESYQDELKEICSIDKDISEVFGFCNAWWVFGEVAKEQDYEIFMSEAQNIGYKRGIKSEKVTSNDLFDLEYAPNTLNQESILKYFNPLIEKHKEILANIKQEIDKLKSTNEAKTSNIKEKKCLRLQEELQSLQERLLDLEQQKEKALNILETYYENNKIKEEFFDRTDETLIHYFKNGIMKQWVSNDILLRKNVEIKILDSIRKQIQWD